MVPKAINVILLLVRLVQAKLKKIINESMKKQEKIQRFTKLQYILNKYDFTG